MNQRMFIAKARSILSDNAGVRKLPHQRSGKFLDESRLGLVRAGEIRVFQKPIKRQFSQYHVVLLMDASGSMMGGRRPTKLEYAVWCTHALAYSLKEAGAKVDVVMFNCKMRLLPEETIADIEKFNDIAHASAWNEGDGNHDGGAIKVGRELLLKGGMPGKISLTLSDGQPLCSGCGDKHCHYHGGFRNEKESLLHELPLSRRAGITPLAVGILTDAPLAYYGAKQTRIVYNLANLYSCMAQLLEKNIVRG